MQIFFFHGLESGPHGAKYHAIREHHDVISPDFRDQDLETRLKTAEEATRGQTDAILVGSSFGGLVAALLYDRYPERFSTYLLLAPAVHSELAAHITHAPATGTIIHGTHDDVVLIEPVRLFAQAHGLAFIEVDDEHRLANSMDIILKALF